MPKITYVNKRFGKSSLTLIAHTNAIIEDYSKQGFDLTLRQIYYQIVARDLFPDDRRWRWVEATRKWVRDANGTKNADPNYKWLGGIINDARLAGLVDWNAIVDRTRNLKGLGHWNNPGDIIESAAYSFKVDKWADQDYRPEVWVEKDALVGVIGSVCNGLDVPFFSCRGYTSQSEMWGAGQRLKSHVKNCYTPIIFHLGDHDPSGIDMTRDIEERLEMFMGGTKLDRLALNMPQVRKFNPPPNPAKLTDSRCDAYIAEFGDESWELDALDPKTISGLIRDAVLEIRDQDKWDEAVEREDAGVSKLKLAAANWDVISERLSEDI